MASRSAVGRPASASVQGVRIGGNGRHVLFSSQAANLVAGDTNNQLDAFIHDRIGLTSVACSLSADGNLVSFESTATTFVVGAGVLKTRVYLRDRAAATTSLVAIPDAADRTGSQPRLSADGSRLAFVNTTANGGAGSFDDSGREKIFLFDRDADHYRALTWYDSDTPAGTTQAPYLSADGRYLVFRSTRSDLDPPDEAALSVRATRKTEPPSRNRTHATGRR